MSDHFEVYKSAVHSAIVNHKDVSASDASAAINFNEAIVQQTKKHLNDRYDLFCLDQMLKVRNGEVLYSEVNEDFEDFSKEFQEANNAKLQTSFINNDSTEYSWIAPKASSENLAEFDAKDSSKFFETAVNQLVKEEEAYGMATKVFICQECQTGTSYAAEKLNKDAGSWTCNNCSSENDITKNQFYIYNKPDVSIISLLSINEARESILNAYQDIKEYAEPKKCKFDVDNEFLAGDDGEIRDIGTAPFFQNIKTLKINGTDETFYSQTTINVNIGCSEVKLNDSTSFYCFWLQFVDWEFISELENFIHRLMFIPKTTDIKLDELLAVLTDDLSRLVSEGIHFDKEGEEQLLKFNILNLNATKAVINDLKSRAELSTLAKLTNVNGVIIPNFTEILINNATKSLLKNLLESISEEQYNKLKQEVDLKIDEEDPEPELPEEVEDDEAEDEEVQEDDDDSDFEDVDEAEEEEHDDDDPLTGEDLQNFKDTQQDLTLNKYHTVLLLFPEILELIESIPEEYITLFGLLRSISFCSTGSEVAIEDLKQLYAECKEFVAGFEKLACAEEVAEVQPLTQIARYFHYFGPLERFSKSQLMPNELGRIVESYKTEENINIVNSLGKADVVLNNYFNVYERVFQTGDSCVDEDLLSTRFEAIIIGGLHDHGHSHSHSHEHGHTHGGEACGGHSH